MDTSDERQLLGKPDVLVGAKNGTPARTSGGRNGATLTQPVRVTLPVARKRKHRLVKVVGPDRARVVTAIEVLSPSNKEPGPDREKYLSKRDEFLGAGTNLAT